MIISKGMENSPEYQKFASDHLRTKDEVLASIAKKTKEYKRIAKDDRKTPASFYAVLDSMLHTFEKRIRAAVLFDELPLWWIYNYDLEYDQFVLYMEHVKQIEIDEYFPNNYAWIPDARYDLVGLSFKTLSAGEYAELYDVGVGTVRQWIRRGKMRTATKIGNEWQIPVLSVPPSRGYEMAQYIWHEEMENLPNEYAYLNNYKHAFFTQDSEDKSKFHVLLVAKENASYEGTDNIKQLVLTAKEREKLELIMIARPEIRYCKGY